MTFSEIQNYCDRKQISGCLELGVEEGFAAKGQTWEVFFVVLLQFSLLIMVVVTQI